MKQLIELGERLDVSKETLDKASELVDKYRDSVKGYKEEQLPAAALHIASRLQNEPRTQKMILSEMVSDRHLFSQRSAEYSRDELKRNIRDLVKKLRRQPEVDLSLVRSYEHLPYVVSRLDDVDEEDEVVDIAEEYCRRVENDACLSRSKVAIAGACLKAAVEESSVDYTVTHAQLAEITGMNRTTFENNLDELQEKVLN